MSCAVCPNSDAWHRRQIEHLANEIGQDAVYEFEADHPEKDEDWEDD